MTIFFVVRDICLPPITDVNYELLVLHFLTPPITKEEAGLHVFLITRILLFSHSAPFNTWHGMGRKGCYCPWSHKAVWIFFRLLSPLTSFVSSSSASSTRRHSVSAVFECRPVSVRSQCFLTPGVDEAIKRTGSKAQAKKKKVSHSHHLGVGGDLSPPPPALTPSSPSPLLQFHSSSAFPQSFDKSADKRFCAHLSGRPPLLEVSTSFIIYY